MSKPGLRQGFLEFGTTAHQILLHLHKYGKLRYIDIAEGLDLDVRLASTVMRRLRVHGFVHIDSYSYHRDSGERTQAVYSLKRPHRRPMLQPETEAERMAKRRRLAKYRVASVFEWRP